MFHEVLENGKKRVDITLGGEGKTCFCLGTKKEIKVTQRHIDVYTENTCTETRQLIDLQTIDDITLYKPKACHFLFKLIFCGLHRASSKWRCDCDFQDAVIIINYASGSEVIIDNVKSPTEVFQVLCQRIKEAKLGPKRMTM